MSIHDLSGDTGRRGGVRRVPSMEKCIAHLMLSCTLSDVYLFSFFLEFFFQGGWSSLQLRLHDLLYPAPGAMETGLVDWTIGLITPSYGKLKICSSCLSWPMSVSVLLASIHSALHVDNNLSYYSLSSTSVCDYLNLYRCITALPCVMQMHQAFFSILYSPLLYSRFISVLV